MRETGWELLRRVRVTTTLACCAVLSVTATLGLRVAPATGQACRPATVDSGRAQRLVDSLEGRRPRPAWVDSTLNRPRRARWDIYVRTVAVSSNLGCWTAVSLNWSPPFGGALLLETPDGRTVTVTRYAGIGHLQGAGSGRVAFSYRAGHGSAYGAGVVSDRFVVLCSFGTWHWAECLDLPEWEDENTAREWTATDSTVGLYTSVSGDFTIAGDSVLVHRRMFWTPILLGGELGTKDSVDLGISVFRLPRLP